MPCKICDLEHEGVGTSYCCAALICEKSTIKNAYNAAIDYAIEQREYSRLFLTMWREGDWSGISKEFPSFNLSTAAPCGYSVPQNKTA